jgi:hypothetical protein
MTATAESNNPTCYTILNLLLQIGITLMSISILSIVSDQLVFQTGQWTFCLLQNEKALASWDAYRNYGNCGATQFFSAGSAIMSIILIFTLVIQLLHQQRPNFTIIMALIITATSFAFVSMIIYNIGYAKFHLESFQNFKQFNQQVVENGRTLSGVNFGFCFASLLLYVLEANKFML